MHTDPIADMLARVRNAHRAGLPGVNMPASRIKREIARVMKAEGYISAFVVHADDGLPELRLELKYNDAGQPAINGLRRESKPGLRRYCGFADIPRVLNGLGTAILSTSQGVMSGKEARQRKLGGEVICTVW
jgi:small subunit ribosomal protein S8